VAIATSKEGVAKFAVVVSKKTARRAVDRNFLKRRSKEALRPHLKNAPPASIVIYPKKEALKTSYSAFAAELSDILSRLLARPR
jgi:ribonuclease P protein component